MLMQYGNIAQYGQVDGPQHLHTFSTKLNEHKKYFSKM